MEEPEDEEWSPSCSASTSTSKCYLGEPDYGKHNGGDGKLGWICNMGKKILVAGLVASSAPIVIPPLFVVSAIGIVVSVPYAFFLASHACTEALMSSLLPRPNYHDDPRLLDDDDDDEDVWFLKQDAGMHIDKKEQFCADETNREIGMVGGDDVASDGEYVHAVVREHEDEPGLLDSLDADNVIELNGRDKNGLVGVQRVNDEKDVTSDGKDGHGSLMDQGNEPRMMNSPNSDDVVQHDGSREDGKDVFCGEREENGMLKMHDGVKIGDEIAHGVEGQVIRESKWEETASRDHGVVITVECVDEAASDDIEEFKTPVEELWDQAIEGDIEQEELERETKGLLEKIRDEGRTDSAGECLDGIRKGTNESDQEIGPDVENLEVVHEDDRGCSTIEMAEGDSRNKVYEMFQPSNVENEDNIYKGVESSEPIISVLDEKEAEHCELMDQRNSQYEAILDEPVRDLVTEKEDHDIPVTENSSEVTNEKIDMDIIVSEEPDHVLDGPTVIQEGKSDNNFSGSMGKESQQREFNDFMDSSDADAKKFSDENGFDLHDENRIDTEADADTTESSKVIVDGHSAPTEVPVYSVEQELRPSEYSSGKDIMSPFHEVVFNEGTESDAGMEEDKRVRENMLKSRNTENEGIIFNEVESAEPIIGMLEEEVDHTGKSQKQMAEHSELLDGRDPQHEAIPAEPVGDLVIEKPDSNIQVTDYPPMVTSDGYGPTKCQEEFDRNISGSLNQESELHEYNEVMKSTDADDATKIVDGSGLNLSYENRKDPYTDASTDDLHEGSSNLMVDGRSDSIEVMASSAGEELKPSEFSSTEEITCPSNEVALNEEYIWKQIDAIRKIIGYEGTKEASYVDELKALYILTGVEPPTLQKENPYDPSEINEKLRFIMSIVGVKSNED